MYDIAEQVSGWLAAGREVRIAQVVATQGFSSRDPAAALAWSGDERVGTLGIPADPPDAPGRHELDVSDADAATVGLSCGGRATVLVQDAAALPDGTWARLVAREPVCLVSSGDGTRLFTRADIRDAAGLDAEIPWLVGRGASATAVLGEHAVVALWPVPTLVVVGEGTIAAALSSAADLLGWTSRVGSEVPAGLNPCDAVVVLSHDRDVDGPALTAALASEAGYVGALGSRRTQAARREWLTERGVTGLERIHGPAGLDIDAHTPGEIAVSIVAEILAERAQTGGGPISERGGPVHRPPVSG